MNKNIVLSLIVSAMLALLLVGCGSSGTSDLTGTWKSDEKNGTYQRAQISGDTIEIYWVNDNEKMEALYWKGTYTAPDKAVTSYSWTSKGDTEKMKNAIMASKDDTKDFTYENGTISYQMSMMGTTTKVELKKQQ